MLLLQPLTFILNELKKDILFAAFCHIGSTPNGYTVPSQTADASFGASSSTDQVDGHIPIGIEKHSL